MPPKKGTKYANVTAAANSTLEETTEKASTAAVSTVTKTGEILSPQSTSTVNAQNVESQVKKSIFDNFRLILNESENIEIFVEKITSVICEAVNTQLSSSFHELNTKCDAVELLNMKMAARIVELENKMDVLDNYERRNSLIIHGLQNVKGDNTDEIVLEFFESHLNLSIPKDKISRSHILPRRDLDRGPSVIVKFVDYRTRAAVYRSKRMLKGKKIVIYENITKNRNILLRECKELFGARSVWTLDTLIKLKDKNGMTHTLSSKAELDKLKVQLNYENY